MQSHLNEVAGVWDSSTGAFLSEKHQRLAEILHDYNPHYSLIWIPPKDRSATDTKPYAILDSSPASAPYIMRYLSEVEMMNPGEVLAWIFDGDLSKKRPIDVLRKIENRENAEELMKLRQKEEELEDMSELAGFMMTGGRNKLNTYRHNGKVFRR